MIRNIDTKEVWNGEPIDEVRHPKSIAKLWSDEELAQIGLERFTPEFPEQDPVEPLSIPLNPVQFEAVLNMTGKRAEIDLAVEAMEEPARSIAKAKIARSQSYDRDDPLFASLAAAIEMTETELDGLWLQALEIE
jgi:hypothetical protein